jgi:hypothetical protein
MENRHQVIFGFKKMVKIQQDQEKMAHNKLQNGNRNPLHAVKQLHQNKEVVPYLVQNYYFQVALMIHHQNNISPNTRKNKLKKR